MAPKVQPIRPVFHVREDTTRHSLDAYRACAKALVAHAVTGTRPSGADLPASPAAWFRRHGSRNDRATAFEFRVIGEAARMTPGMSITVYEDMGVVYLTVAHSLTSTKISIFPEDWSVAYATDYEIGMIRVSEDSEDVPSMLIVRVSE